MSTYINPSSWLIIVNPNAGHGRGQKDWHKISSLLQKYALRHYVHFTYAKGHAIKLASEGIRHGYRKIIIVGGDGIPIL
jgi:diacylglycerol kinase family enzyme